MKIIIEAKDKLNELKIGLLESAHHIIKGLSETQYKESILNELTYYEEIFLKLRLEKKLCIELITTSDKNKDISKI